jgi:hypothetical protein
VRYDYEESGNLKLKKPRSLINLEINNLVTWGFFDGDFQGNPSACEVGGILYLKENYFVSFKYAIELGGNNKTKFMHYGYS